MADYGFFGGMSRTSKHLITAVKCILMAALVIYLFKSGMLSAEALEPLFSFSTALAFVLSLMLILFQTFIFTRRYELVISAAGYPVNYKDLFKIVNIGLFFGNFLPSSAGGDIFRIYYLKSHCGLPIMQAAAITLIDRIFAFLGLIILSFVSLAVVLVHKKGIFGIDGLIVAGITAIPLLCIAFLFLLRIPLFYNLAEKIVGKAFFGEKLLSFLSTARALAKNLKVCFTSLSLAIFGQILIIAAVTLIASAMYGSSAALASAAVAGLVLASAIIPLTPGNLGMTEFVAEILFGYMGSGGGAAIILVWRVCQFVFSILGGIFYLFIGKTAAST
jgi:uncharacterized protein (TIRG00374 family)